MERDMHEMIEKKTVRFPTQEESQDNGSLRLSQSQLSKMRQFVTALSQLRDEIVGTEVKQAQLVAQYIQISMQYQQFNAQLSELFDLGQRKIEVDWETGVIRTPPEAKEPIPVLAGIEDEKG